MLGWNVTFTYLFSAKVTADKNRVSSLKLIHSIRIYGTA